MMTDSESVKVPETECLLKPGIEKVLPADDSDAPISAWPEVKASVAADPQFWAIIFFVAFIQGSQSLSDMATTYVLKDELKVSPAVSDSITGFAVVPWVVKPLYGFISDGYPIKGYHRRPYLIFASLLSSFCLAMIATLPFSLGSLIFFSFVGSMGGALASTVGKAILVEKCEGKSVHFASFLQSYFWITLYAVSIPGTLAGGYMVDHTNKHYMYICSATASLSLAFVAFFYHDKESTGSRPVCEQLKTLLGTLRGHGYNGFPLWKPALFVLLFSGAPGSGSSLFYFFTEKLKMDPEFMALSGVIATVFAIIGTMAYQAWFADKPYRPVLVGASIVACFFSSLPIVVVLRWNLEMGLPDKAFVLSDNAITSAVGQVALLPLLVMASRICPPGIEGTLYALIMSISNMGMSLSNLLGSALQASFGITRTNYDNLPWLLLTSSLLSLLPCAFVSCLLPGSDADTMQGAKFLGTDKKQDDPNDKEQGDATTVDAQI